MPTRRRVNYIFAECVYAIAMTETEETFGCDGCGRTVTAGTARRTETIGDLDSKTWQTLCCPHCGSRLKTVYVDE